MALDSLFELALRPLGALLRFFWDDLLLALLHAVGSLVVYPLTRSKTPYWLAVAIGTGVAGLVVFGGWMLYRHLLSP